MHSWDVNILDSEFRSDLQPLRSVYFRSQEQLWNADLKYPRGENFKSRFSTSELQMTVEKWILAYIEFHLLVRGEIVTVLQRHPNGGKATAIS